MAPRLEELRQTKAAAESGQMMSSGENSAKEESCQENASVNPSTK